MGTVARTAVVAGTASATAGAVSRHQANKQAEREQAAAYEQQQAAPPPQEYAPPPQQYEAPPPAPQPADGGTSDLIAQLQQLGQMRDSGVLTDAEFAAAKQKLLGS